MPKRCRNSCRIDVTEDIHSLTTFKRNSSGLMKPMKTDRALVLTVNGKAEAVLLDAAAYPNSRTTWIRSRVYAEALGRPEKGQGRLVDDRLGELEREG